MDGKDTWTAAEAGWLPMENEPDQSELDATGNLQNQNNENRGRESPKRGDDRSPNSSGHEDRHPEGRRGRPQWRGRGRGRGGGKHRGNRFGRGRRGRDWATNRAMGEEAIRAAEVLRKPPPTELTDYEYHSEFGWYYDTRTGYYVVDLEKRQFYDGMTRTYLQYSDEERRYVAYDPSKSAEKEVSGASSAKEDDNVSGDKEKTTEVVEDEPVLPKHPEPLKFGLKPVPKAAKVNCDLNRWKKRQELAKEEPSDALKVLDDSGDSLRDKQRAPKPEPQTAELPTGSNPAIICELCRRKFKSADQLAKHEKLSDLHKKNLELQAAKVQIYRDRASERKELFPSDGEEEPHVNSKRRKANKAEKVDQLGESNFGNKLMKSMGWKAGEGLGKGGTASALEAVVRTERKGLGAEGDPTLVVDPSDSHRERISKLTKARWQHMNSGG